ncbi:MAG: hypothetical protein Q9168_001940 [Polycauliona sp. 1 TL-2023]
MRIPHKKHEFLHAAWGPGNRTWATALLIGDLAIKKGTFEFQTSELTQVLELRSGLSFLEELLDIAGILETKVDGRFDIPRSHGLETAIDEAFRRIIQSTRRLNSMRRHILTHMIAKDVEKEAAAQSIPYYNISFAFHLTQTMPKAADPSNFDHLDDRGIQTIIANASELRRNMEGWRAESDLELLHMKDQLVMTWAEAASYCGAQCRLQKDIFLIGNLSWG